MSLENILQGVDIVCFDVDSTVITVEAIDQFAAFLGKGEEVAAVTKRAMEGSMKFQDALGERLRAMNPNDTDLDLFLKHHPFEFTPYFVDMINELQRLQIEINFVSGGFDAMIIPIADKFQIPKNHVYANTILFDENGCYSGFDPSKYTSQDMGKQKAVSAIIEIWKSSHVGYIPKVIMVGDGATDLQAKPPADYMIGYGGIARREKVEKEADVFILSFEHIYKILKGI